MTNVNHWDIRDATIPVFDRKENLVGKEENAGNQFEIICRRQNKVTVKMKFIVEGVENIVGIRRKCWLPAFSPFPIVFSKGFPLWLI